MAKRIKDREPEDVLLGRRIKSHRETNGLSQLQLAERMRVAGATISNWESGVHRPSPRQIRLLAGIFVIDEWTLYGFGTSSEQPSDLTPDAARASGEFDELANDLRSAVDRIIAFAETQLRLSASRGSS